MTVTSIAVLISDEAESKALSTLGKLHESQMLLKSQLARTTLQHTIQHTKAALQVVSCKDSLLCIKRLKQLQWNVCELFRLNSSLEL